MILRFSSGSVTPASAVRKVAWASTTCSLTPVAATKSRSTCSASPLRSRPWSTKTQVELVADRPLDDRAAATAESTPPDSPQIAWPRSPIWARIDSICSSTMLTIVQVWPAAGDVEQEVLEDLLAVLGVQHLRVPLHAGQPTLEVLERGHGVVAVDGEHGEACRRLGRPSRRATSTRCAGRHVGEQRAGLGRPVTGVRPYSRRRCGRPRRRGPGPSPGSRSTCRTPGPRT